MRRFRLVILWFAAVFVVAGSAFGFAAVKDKHGPDDAKKVKPTVAPADRDAADEAGEKEKDESDGPSAERKHNHGFFVSQAAHCEDVDDPESAASPDFKAPADCDGPGHGKYVSSVAKSSLGKKQKD